MSDSFPLLPLSSFFYSNLGPKRLDFFSFLDVKSSIYLANKPQGLAITAESLSDPRAFSFVERHMLQMWFLLYEMGDKRFEKSFLCHKSEFQVFLENYSDANKFANVDETQGSKSFERCNSKSCSCSPHSFYNKSPQILKSVSRTQITWSDQRITH